jgi:DNA-directed RNA polymerase specialized sigma24 family protein
MNYLRKSVLRMVLVGVACGSYLLTALPAAADVKVYVASFNARTVTVINPATNTFVNTIPAEPVDELIALDAALSEFAGIDERASRVVELRFFGGLSVDEVAKFLGVSQETSAAYYPGDLSSNSRGLASRFTE